MKFNYRLLVGAAALIALAGACSKKYKQPDTVEPNVVNPFGGPPGSLTPGSQLNKLFKDLRSVPERQCVTAGVLQVVQFKKGTILTFYPNSFKDKTGKIITEGTVCLDVVEMYNPGSMIANRATTVSADGILESGGQVYIKATKDGQEVFANKYGIAYKQKSPSSKTMALYFGDTKNTDSVVMWGKANTDIGMVAAGTRDTTEVTDTTLTEPESPWNGSFFIFDSCTDFNWVNCDMFYQYTGPRAFLDVRIADTAFNKKNTMVYVVMPDINGANVAWFYNDDTKAFHFGADQAHQFPIGMNVRIIVVSSRDNTYYYYEQPVFAITTTITIRPEMTAKSLEFIKTRLGEL
jgi:hypothetical protein